LGDLALSVNQVEITDAALIYRPPALQITVLAFEEQISISR
jgi:hypothetical protein